MLIWRFSIDSRQGMTNTEQETVPEGPASLQLKKKTSKISIHIEGDQVTCESDAFPEINDPCSDVQEQKQPDIVFCPATFMPLWVYAHNLSFIDYIQSNPGTVETILIELCWVTVSYLWNWL